MGTARDIPGYHFDKERNRYFKIVPGFKATPGHKYTTDYAKKELKKEKEALEDQHRAKRRKKETVVHSKSLLAHAHLQREIGYSRPSYYVKGLWPGACVAEYEPQSIVAPVSGRNVVRYFDRSADSKFLYTAGEHSIFRREMNDQADPMVNNVDDEVPPFSADYFERQRLLPEELIRMTSEVSSMNYLPASGGLVMTTYGSDRHPVIYFSDPETDGPYVGEQFTPRHCPAVWNSAPKPSFSVSDPGTGVLATETELVAVGASKALHIYTRTPSSGTWTSDVVLSKTSSDVLGLCWISPTSLMFGGRDGTINIYDTRTKHSQHILSHPAPINHIRRTDNFSRIVVSGLCDTMKVYDIRAGAPEKLQKHRPVNRSMLGEKTPFPGSTAITTFSEYKNNNILDLGMDVSGKFGLVASADEDGMLRIWNMHTGAMVKSFNSDEVYRSERPWTGQNPNPGARIRCVRFVEDDEGGVSLWANLNGGITKFSW